MLRAVLLGVLTVTSVVACKSEGGTSAKSQPGVAAGKVVEVKGAVTVKHGDASRPLAAGESVEGDDVVTTGADGNVVIELAHNLVRWELGPNKTQKVRDSIAFKAAKNTAPVANVDQDTAAAGRPAERSAVGTTAMEVEDKADSEAPAAAAPAAPPPPAPGAAAEPAPAAAPAEPPPERKRSRPSRTRRESAKKEAAPEIPSAEAAMAAPREEAAPADGLRTTRGGTRAPIARTITPPQAPPAPMATASAAPSPSAGGATPASLVAGKQPALKACLGSQTDSVMLQVTVSGGNPTVRLTSKSAVSAELDACVKKVIASISFSADGKVTTMIKP
jgi:hypothetical protein